MVMVEGLWEGLCRGKCRLKRRRLEARAPTTSVRIAGRLHFEAKTQKKVVTVCFFYNLYDWAYGVRGIFFTRIAMP